MVTTTVAPVGAVDPVLMYPSNAAFPLGSCMLRQSDFVAPAPVREPLSLVIATYLVVAVDPELVVEVVVVGAAVGSVITNFDVVAVTAGLAFPKAVVIKVFHFVVP